MTEQPEGPWGLIKQFAPSVSIFFGLLAVVWSFSSQISANESTVAYQGTQIANLDKQVTDEQTLSYSISSQLAQLSQSVADIKANTDRGQ